MHRGDFQAARKDAKGELHVKVTVLLRHAISIHPGETQMVPPNATLAVGMGWELMKGGRAIDLDTACVCVGITGEVLMDAGEARVEPDGDEHDG